jgi:hypothetical protein
MWTHTSLRFALDPLIAMLAYFISVVPNKLINGTMKEALLPDLQSPLAKMAKLAVPIPEGLAKLFQISEIGGPHRSAVIPPSA